MQDNHPHQPPMEVPFRIAIDTLPIALLLFDQNAEIIYANPPAQQLFHHSPIATPFPLSCGEFIRCANHLQAAQPCGHTVFCRQCPLLHALRSVLTGTATETLAGEHLLTDENGLPQWLKYTCTSLTVNQERGALLAIEDITRQRQTEQNYQLLFHQMLNAFALHEIICNEDGIPVDYRFLAVNPAFEQMTGLTAAQVVGQTVLNLLPATEPHWISIYGQVALTGKAVHFENYSRELDKHFAVTAFQPAPGQFACLFNDITERKQAEKLLRENEEHLNLVLEGANLASWDWHVPSGTLTFNDIWPTMLGYTRAEIEPHVNSWKQLVHPEDFPRVMQALDAHLEGLTSHYETEHRLRHKSGHWVWVLDKGRVIERDAAGRPLRTCGTHHDISERKHNEEERKHLQNQLLQAQKMEAIGTLAGGIAHDFNNILSAVLGYTEMARGAIPPESPAAQHLDKVMEASLRASTLAKQILTFSRQGEPEKIALEPALIVKETIKLLRSTLPATIVIRQQIAPRTSLIFADPIQIHQVLLNLCTNSFHAMEQTGGILDISLETCTASPPGAPAAAFVRLSVSDTGHGIPPELQEKIFQPYFTTKEVGKGTGLGLAIVHGIVTKHGGFITCESSPDSGTTFHLHFPTYTGTSTLVPRPEEPPATGREHILLVDDEKVLVETGTALLKRLGYTVTGRTGSLEALEIFQDQPHRFDAMITDQTMPEMTGLELAQRLLRIRPDLPIILCTGYSGLVSEEQVLALGIKAFVMKPLTKKDLAATLRGVLDKKSE
ncbi:hybrid sensor histidine kinase/response regulator [Desulfobulbus alkaliphilus]|uniref:hybrid sensor histidine kinase/response regulator n=1 Tax=Desulfobulbus alkaliphilus TaxID=869814 RepID=UPI00196266E4|nr:PAS domain S-box protein [Desulfobulbus alkaliphilus]MBM9536350.1 PAS domain S-box protein [Desulfobulbus alkaliphilus]